MRETSENIPSRYEEPLGWANGDATENELRQRRTLREQAWKNERYKPSLKTPLLLTTVLIFFAALAIVTATSLIWNVPKQGTLQVVLNVFNGMLLSLPVLISVWLVLGGQTWIIRIPLAFFSLLALSGIFLGTIFSLEGSIPAEVYLIIGGVTLAVSIATQIPLWIFGLRYGALITRASSGSVVKTQFTIKQLLITTTVFAFLVPFLQWVATFEDFENAPMFLICGFCGVFIVVLVFLMLFSVLVVFSKHRIKSLCILVLGIAALPFVVVPSLISVMEQRFAYADFLEMGSDVFLFLDMGSTFSCSRYPMQYPPSPCYRCTTR